MNKDPVRTQNAKKVPIKDPFGESDSETVICTVHDG